MSHPTRYRRHVLLACIPMLALPVLMASCGTPLPSLDKQKAQIMNHDIRLQRLSSRAFLETWGPAEYEHHLRTQFYPVKDGNLIPQFRVPLGEAPPQWQVAVVSEEGHFMGYPDRGEFLGFIKERLVYREKMPAEEIHAIGKAWERNERFRTMLEKGLSSAP